MTMHPTAGRAEPFAVPAHTVVTLQNGFRATRIAAGSVPKVQAKLVIRTGASSEVANQCWLSKLLADMLMEGAGTLDGAAVAASLAAMGGRLEVDAGDDLTTLSAQALSEFAPNLVRLLATIARYARLPEAEVPRLKANLSRRRAIAASQPNTIALAAFRSALYGDHPYGRILPPDGGIDAFTAKDIREYFQAQVGAQRSTLYLAGPLDAAAVDAAIEEGFGDWATGPAPRPNPPDSRSERLVHLVERPGVEQSTIYLGLPVPDPSHPDYVPLTVVNALIGGAFMSRITMNIREAKGYTYSPRSELSTRYRDAYWVEMADVTTAVTGAALSEIFGELERLRDEPVPDDELVGIQNFVAGNFVVQNATPGGLIEAQRYVDFHELGDAHLNTYIDQVYAVNAADVHRLTLAHLRPEAMTIAIAGDTERILGQVADFGTVVRG